MTADEVLATVERARSAAERFGALLGSMSARDLRMFVERFEALVWDAGHCSTCRGDGHVTESDPGRGGCEWKVACEGCAGTGKRS